MLSIGSTKSIEPDSLSLPSTLASTLASKTSSFNSFPKTESPVFHDRLLRPGNHLLVDANYSLITETFFYQSPSFQFQSLWNKNPKNDLYHIEYMLMKPSQKLLFGSNLGNEVGDPHLQEVTGATYANHTPLTQAYLVYKPNPSFSISLQGNQNDHFTYTQIEARRALVKNQVQSWFGENIPPRSLITGSFTLTQPGYTLSFLFSQGWLWTTSPQTGFSYPWKGYQHQTEATLFDFFRLSYSKKNWESQSMWDSTGYWTYEEWLPEVYYNKLKGPYQVQLGVYTGIGSFSTGMKKKQLAPAYIPDIETKNEKYLRTGIHFDFKKSSRDSSFTQQLRSQFEYINGSPKGTTQICFVQSPVFGEIGESGEKRGSLRFGTFRQSLKYYIWNPLNEYANLNESWNSGEPGEHSLAKGKNNAQGIGLQLDFAKKSFFDFKIELGATEEWNLPLFSPDSFFTESEQIFRSGTQNSRSKSIPSLFQNLRTRKDILPWLSLGADFNLRKYFESEGEELEFLPSQFQCHFIVNAKSPSNLDFRFISSYLSQKELRGWKSDGSTFVIPAHWETNFSLIQSFLKERIQVHYTALYFFGEEILEHPNGNPLRFRIIVGGEAAF